MLYLNSCCCGGFSLRTGTMVIGALCALRSLLVVLVAICVAVVTATRAEAAAAAAAGAAGAEAATTTEAGAEAGARGHAGPWWTQPGVFSKSPEEVAVGICVVVAAYSALFGAVSLALVYAVCKERERVVRAWLWYNGLTLLLEGALAALYVAWASGGVASGLARLTHATLFIGLNVYYILVVNSYHAQLVSDRQYKTLTEEL